MNRARCHAWLFGVFLLAFVGSQPLFAISPGYIMIYGDGLQKPIVVQVTTANSPAYEFLWDPHRGGVGFGGCCGTLPPGLSGRLYLKVAIFWGKRDLATLKPEDANQHGRLYVGDKSDPSVILATLPFMNEPAARPIPQELREFPAGWTLTAEDLATAKRLGVPGL
jgi:hypothetical protein